MPAKTPQRSSGKSSGKSTDKSNGKSPRTPDVAPAPRAASQPRVQPLAANGEIRLSANDLRALAEEADGLRDADAVVIHNPDAGRPGQRPYRIVRDSDARSSGVEPVLRLRTDNAPPFAKRTPVLTLSSEPRVSLSAHPALTLGHCDAIFTSISAMDKFIIPYYQRIRGLAAVQAARQKYATDPTALAVVHLPESIDDTLRAVGSMYAVVAEPAAPGALAQDFRLRGFIDEFIED